MKTLFNTALPALALLALGGCATTGAVYSSENDDVYYSSKDRTTVAPAATNPGGYYGAGTAQTPAPAGENANPDYQGGTAQSGTASSTDYYDDNYNYNSVQPSGFGQPYTGPGLSSYNYTPNWSASPSFYGSPWGYGTGLSLGYGYGGFGGYGYSPFGYGYGYPAYAGFYDPFYSPFYSPWGYGSGFSIGFGYGYGGFGYPYYGGWGYPGYAAYGYPYGAGYYGGGGYYGGDYGYGGARRYVYKQDIVNGRYTGNVGPGTIMVGRRESRAVNAVGAAGAVAPGGGTVGASAPSGRVYNGGANSGFNRAVAPAGQPAGSYVGNNPAAAAAAAPSAERERRFQQATVNPNSPGATDMNANRGGWGRPADASGAGYNQPRTADAGNPAGGAAPQGRRGGFFRDVFSAPSNPGGNAGNQGGFSQPQRPFSQPNGGFSQPRMEQRSFQPAQPSPSFDGGGRGNFGGGGGGGGSFGGGGGGGGGRRGR